MIKLLITVFLSIILSSCDIALFDEKLSLDENPFINPMVLKTEKDGDDTLNFLVMTDAHINREYRDSNVWRNNENLFLFLENNKDIDAILMLGDMIDDAVDMDYEGMHEFLSDINGIRRYETPIIYTLGNHDANKGSSVKTWENEFGTKAMESYRIADTMIYKLNSSFRLFGHDQIAALREAMKENDAKYSFIITHVPLGSKGLDQSLFEFTIADINERNAILKVIDENGSALTLSGHHHKGGVLNSWSGSHKEYIFSAFHKRDLMGLESPGLYYLVSLDQDSGMVTVKGFLIDNINPDIANPDLQLSFFIK